MTQKLFSAQALTKIHTSGGVEVRALRGVDLDFGAGDLLLSLKRSARCGR